jgi:hypothetical protein
VEVVPQLSSAERLAAPVKQSLHRSHAPLRKPRKGPVQFRTSVRLNATDIPHTLVTASSPPRMLVLLPSYGSYPHRVTEYRQWAYATAPLGNAQPSDESMGKFRPQCTGQCPS